MASHREAELKEHSSSHKEPPSPKTSGLFFFQLNFPVTFFQPFSAVFVYFGLPSRGAESEVGGVEGGVMGDPVEEDVARESSVTMLSPLPFADNPLQEFGKCVECLCHPRLALNGEDARGFCEVEGAVYEWDINSNCGGGDADALLRRSNNRSSRLPLRKRSSEE